VVSDYILRLIDQIALMLSEIFQLRKLGRTGAAHADISKACLENVGLPFELAKHSAPETILEMLATGGGTQHVAPSSWQNCFCRMPNWRSRLGKNAKRSLAALRRRR